MKFIDNRSIRLVDELRRLLEQCDTALFATAFIRRSGAEALISQIRRVSQRGGKIYVLFGNDWGNTEADAVLLLMQAGCALRYYSGPHAFHPKCYLFEQPDTRVAIVGSSNISASGLSSGTEWSLTVDSDRELCTRIGDEFWRLWNSARARPVTNEVTDGLRKQTPERQLAAALAKQDRLPRGRRPPAALGLSELLDRDRNYVLTKRRDHRTCWYFQLSVNQLRRYASTGDDFYLVVICDFESPDYELVFAIPYAHLRKKIMSDRRIHIEHGKEMHFNVHKKLLRFNWVRSVPMDGLPFLVQRGGRRMTSE